MCHSDITATELQIAMYLGYQGEYRNKDTLVHTDAHTLAYRGTHIFLFKINRSHLSMALKLLHKQVYQPTPSLFLS